MIVLTPSDRVLIADALAVLSPDDDMACRRRDELEVRFRTDESLFIVECTPDA